MRSGDAITITTHKTIVRLEGDRVLKRFSPARGGYRRCRLERAALTRMQGIDGMPELLGADADGLGLHMKRIDGSSLQSGNAVPDEAWIDLRRIVEQGIGRGVARHSMPARDLLLRPDGRMALVDFERVTLRGGVFGFGLLWFIACLVGRYHLLSRIAEFAPHLLSPDERSRLRWQVRVRNLFIFARRALYRLIPRSRDADIVHPQYPFTSAMRWAPFAACHLVALALLGSWLWGPTRHWWDLFDDQIFLLLNGTLQDQPRWAAVWALATLRPMGIVTGLAIFYCITRRDWAFDAGSVRKALLGFLAMLGLLLQVRFGFAALVSWLEWERLSPSLVTEGAVRLSELFPDWEPMDAAEYGFARQQGAVALLWALFMSLFVRGSRLLVVWTLALFFLMPRLVAGAHWSSDDLVGGLVVSLITLAWGFYTPFAAWTSRFLEALTQPFFRVLARSRFLQRFSLVGGA